MADVVRRLERNCRKQAISVRRERHWTTAVDKPARELDRSTR